MGFLGDLGNALGKGALAFAGSSSGWGAALSAGMGLLNSNSAETMQHDAMRAMMHNNKRMMELQYNLNQKSLRESPASRVAGLRAAGLNPLLAAQASFGAAPASTIASQYVPPADVAGAFSKGAAGIASAIQAGQGLASVANIESSTAKNVAEKEESHGRNFKNFVDAKYTEAITKGVEIDNEIKGVYGLATALEKLRGLVGNRMMSEAQFGKFMRDQFGGIFDLNFSGRFGRNQNENNSNSASSGSSSSTSNTSSSSSGSRELSETIQRAGGRSGGSGAGSILRDLTESHNGTSTQTGTLLGSKVGKVATIANALSKVFGFQIGGKLDVGKLYGAIKYGHLYGNPNYTLDNTDISPWSGELEQKHPQGTRIRKRAPYDYDKYHNWQKHIHK